MIELSFIIPAYNTSGTIIRTLDSIYTLELHQDQFEVIIVDDCSTDITREIVTSYASKVNNLRLLCQPENHRQGAARNRGVREAHGEYIMFVDADDKVENGVPAALELAIRKKIDALFCNYIWMYSNNNEELRKMPLDNGFVTSGRDFAEHYYETVINTCPISYLWRREYLLQKGTPFIEDRQMEDFDFIEINVYHAETIGYSTAIIYRVLTYENLSSTTHTMSYKTVADWTHVGYRRMKFCEMIQQEAPTFCRNIISQSRCFIGSSLSFRRLTRFSSLDVKRIFDRVGEMEMAYFYKQGGWSFFNQLCMKYSALAITIIAITHPVAELGRLIVQSIRKIKK